MRKGIAVALSFSMLFSTVPVMAAEQTGLTRNEAAEMLLIAADDYNPTVKKEDILKGYKDGNLNEDGSVTRAEAVVMLKRAFGELPEMTEYTKKIALPQAEFSDLPNWAKEELNDVFEIGIVEETEDGTFAPNEYITKDELEVLISRIFALYGTNEKDDFFEASNKEVLQAYEIKPGRIAAGTIYNLDEKSLVATQAILDEIAAGEYAKGTKEQKIQDFYESVLNMDARDRKGIEPIRPYLEQIDAISSVDDLMKYQETIGKKLGLLVFLNFRLGQDAMDSNKYMLSLFAYPGILEKEAYTDGTENQKNAYLSYLEGLLSLAGEKNAAEQAKAVYEFEKQLSKDRLGSDDWYDIGKTYNIFTMDEIREMYPIMNVDNLLKAFKLQAEDKVIISDVGVAKAWTKLLAEENLETLKTVAKVNLLHDCGSYLDSDFKAIEEKYMQEYYGVEGSYSKEEDAALATQGIMTDYMSQLYAEKYFSAEAKADVQKMIEEIIAVYRERIQELDWMSDSTKAKAIKKLDTMRLKIGYPDTWETYLDHAEIKSIEEGGSYFKNAFAAYTAARDEYASCQGQKVNKDKWEMPSFEVNAYYAPSGNEIAFPAAILQAPLYDINASGEENLGGIGYIIAHEITHAFDNNGAKFDENGNAADWWTREDYQAFEKLCEEMVSFYDGQEGMIGIPTNGSLTLSENIADQGALRCITAVLAKSENPDYRKFYESISNGWACIYTREYVEYLAQIDVHSHGKVRVNRVVSNSDEFYQAFDIDENDGMYVAPEDRVVIW